MNDPLLSSAAVEERVVRLLRQVLALPANESLQHDSRLLGAVPALDSVAVVALLTELEEAFGFAIADEDLSAEAFASVGTLCDWVRRQLAGKQA